MRITMRQYREDCGELIPRPGIVSFVAETILTDCHDVLLGPICPSISNYTALFCPPTDSGCDAVAYAIFPCESTQHAMAVAAFLATSQYTYTMTLERIAAQFDIDGNRIEEDIPF